MNKEHFDYIEKHFNLSQYHKSNGIWNIDREGLVCVSNLYVYRGYRSSEIREDGTDIVVFWKLPPLMAKEVLKLMYETEILFG